LGKFKEALGIGKITIAGVDFEVDPNMLECEAFSHIRKLVETKKDVEGMKKNCDLLYQMILNKDTELTDEDKTELKKLLYINQKEALEEAQILFKWTTREERESHKKMIEKALQNGDILKNLMTP